MKIEDHGTILYLHLIDAPTSIATDEDAELIVLQNNKLCAVRIWLKEVLESIRGETLQNIVVDCVSGGWTLFDPSEHVRRLYYENPSRQAEPAESFAAYTARRQGDCDFRPWIFYQFVPSQGDLRIVDSSVNMFLNEDHSKIVGIEIDLGGVTRLLL